MCVCTAEHRAQTRRQRQTGLRYDGIEVAWRCGVGGGTLHYFPLASLFRFIKFFSRNADIFGC